MEPSPTQLEVQPAAPRPPVTSVAARVLNVIAIPGEVFDEVKASAPSAANWVVPALLLAVIGWLAAWLIFSQESIQQQLREVTQQAIQKQIDKAHLPKEKAEQMQEMAEKYAGFSQKIGAFVMPLGGFVSPLIWGLILWLVGTKALKGSFPFMKAVEVAGLANAIAVLEAIVRTLLIIGMGNLFASPSAALLIKDFDPQKPAHSLLALINPLTFWLLAVRAIGLARLSATSFAKAAAWVFGIWLAYTGFFVGLGLAAQAIFSR